MKRRKFVRGLLSVPAITTAAAAAQTPAPASAPQQQPQPKPDTPARQEARQPSGLPKLKVTFPDETAEPAPHFFSPTEFATLNKLAEVLVPPLKTNPGALDAKAPEFLDFLISVSPGDRQELYRSGLAQLEVQAKNKYNTSFHELNAAQADAILKPLLVARPWPQDLPRDPLQNFMVQVHEDLRTATRNSREWAEASQKSGRVFSRGFSGTGYYWVPIDPISEG